DMTGTGFEQYPVCLMAGGLGSRLRPLTDDTPKPMIRIGDKPILEISLCNLVNQGFREFFIAVNYQAEKIKQHFGDGQKFGCHIRYIEEEKRLGTAGALGLIAHEVARPIVVKNADLLTRARFDHLVNFHLDHKAAATMAIREHRIEVPFGVVEVSGTELLKVTEKPVKKFFVNAAMYVLDPAL